ncbi:MAG: GNAT family N-acetyltransferase [Hahellaceae bacterium]|nr:GNAT family N-acetyltransferase [Hahellaceae bacterium]MCP5210879.1 GNAT family N-acetyltransferase [Hahellaceae bacterium]
MKFLEAGRNQFLEIATLPASAEELYLVYPSGHYPWSVEQLDKLYETRREFTVAVINGSVAAFANLYNVIPGKSAFIGNVIVADAYKGKGVGRALTGHMIRICTEKYGAAAHISVFGFNARAILMYASMGFTPYAVEARKNIAGESVALFHLCQSTEK